MARAEQCDGDAAAADAATYSESQVAERVPMIFDPALNEPSSSGLDRLASSVDKGLMKIAWEVMDGLPKATIDALSTAWWTTLTSLDTAHSANASTPDGS